jgi:C-terminal processing protease CtpA/Prc
LPNITAVGDTTGGGGGAASGPSVKTIGNYTLPSGMIINIPTGYFLRYDGKQFEWLGVPPDIRVQQTKEDIQNGIDKQLEYAIEILK